MADEPNTPPKFKNFQIRWSEPLGNPDCPYAYRWAIIAFGYGLRLHHWVGNDDDRAFHDHPWWMLIFMLKGGYCDNSPSLLWPFMHSDYVFPPEWGIGLIENLKRSIRFRPAEWKHRITLDGSVSTWTFLITGPKTRHHYFYVGELMKRLRPLAYFNKNGHKHCTDD